MSRPLVVPFPEGGELAERIASALGAEILALELHRFPDGEALIRFGASPQGRDIVLVCTLDRPDAKILPLLFAARTARDLGTRRIGLAAPYLAYMRQDKAFAQFQSINARPFAALLSNAFDFLVTVDPHLHRIKALSEIYTIPCETVHASAAIADWIAREVSNPVILGPDSESAQWALDIARLLRAPYRVWTKTRSGDRDVRISPDGPGIPSDQTIVVVDDIIATAATMAETVRDLRAQTSASPICVGVHAVFADGALDILRSAGAARIVTTNTIAHETNAIDVSAAVARAIGERLAAGR